MGLNLSRVSFADWLGPDIDFKQFIKKLKTKLGMEIPYINWTVVDEKYPRVGSYSAYGVFVLCLYYISIGDFEKDLEEDMEIELEALKSFRELFKPKTNNIPYVEHFINTNDSDTIFLPILFENPVKIDCLDLASLPAATKALEVFSEFCGFNLEYHFDEEYKECKWVPFSTVKNIARILYNFFKEKPESCVAFS